MQEGTLDMLIFGCRFAPRCQLGVPWQTHHHEAASACTEWAVRGCRAPPECAIQSRIVPCASGRTRCRGAGSRAGGLPSSGAPVGRLAPKLMQKALSSWRPRHSPHRECGERRHVAREGQAGGAAHRESERKEWLEGRRRSFAVVGDRRDVVFPLSCPVDRPRVLLLWEGRRPSAGRLDVGWGRCRSYPKPIPQGRHTRLGHFSPIATPKVPF